MNTSSFNFGKVAVVMGGLSAERDISLMSGQGVLQALRSRGVDAHAFDPASQPLWTLKSENFDRCFLILHGRLGEDGCIQGALEWMGIPYTGSGVLASSMAMNKLMAKRVWVCEGLPTPAYLELSPAAQHAGQLTQVPAALGWPVVVKPPREGSSIGISVAHTIPELQAAVELAARYDPEVLCEEFIVGDEVTCAVIGTGDSASTLPLVRIQAPQGAYDYQNKYFTDAVQYHCPSGLPAEEEAAISEVVRGAYRTLGCRGWGRADLMIRASDRKPFLLEINLAPGMTSHSLVPKAAQAVGISYEDLCVDILKTAALDYPVKTALTHS